MVKKYDLKQIDFFLRNEQHYLNVIECHFLESSSSENLGVSLNKIGNSVENTAIKKLDDPRYVKAKLIVDSINELRSKCNDIEEELLYYWASLNLNYFQIHRKVNYSESWVKQKILKLRHSLVVIVNKNIGGDDNE